MKNNKNNHSSFEQDFLYNIKQDKKDSNANNWLVTYADLFTILVAFFTLIVASSDVDEQKFEVIRESFSSAFKNEDSQVKKEILNKKQIKEQIENYISENNLEEKIILNENKRGLKVTFPSETFFDIGSAKLRDSSKKILKNILNILATIEYKSYKIAVEGHTDDLPIKTEQYPSNWELSSGRAGSVANFMTSHNFDKHKIKVSGYADTRPIVEILESMNKSEKYQARAKNRRIEIQLIYYNKYF
jgi:chemotaxis protein MotB